MRTALAVFVDTSALYALLDRDDARHPQAAEGFRRLLAARERLVTHSYVVVESVALVQRGLGLEAVRALCHGLLEVVHTVPVDEDLHRAALTALLASGRRDISLVDWTSFFFMQRKGLRKALAFDERFWEQGFSPVEA